MQVRTAILRFSADSIQVNGFAPFFRLIPPENGCGMSKFCTMSSKLSFFSKKAEILWKVVIDTTDSLAEGVSCRQPTAVPLRQKIPPAKREQEQKRAGSQRNQLQFLLQVGTFGMLWLEFAPYHLVDDADVALDDFYYFGADVFVNVVGDGESVVAVAAKGYGGVNGLEE